MLETWNKLIQDQAFTEKLNSCKDEAEVLALLKENGIEVSSVQELRELVAPETAELSDEELEKVSGGGFCIGIGLGCDLVHCWNKGKGFSRGNEGYGGYFCTFVGVGIGSISCHLEGK